MTTHKDRLGYEDEGCEAGRAGLPKREAFDFTLAEDVCLDVTREVLSMYMTADARHWHSAVVFAQRHLGQCNAVRLIAEVTTLVMALRLERHSSFNYLTFGCAHITSDELALMSAMQAAGGQSYELDDALQHLAQSGCCARLRLALDRLRAALDAMSERETFSGEPGGSQHMH